MEKCNRSLFELNDHCLRALNNEHFFPEQPVTAMSNLNHTSASSTNLREDSKSQILSLNRKGKFEKLAHNECNIDLVKSSNVRLTRSSTLFVWGVATLLLLCFIPNFLKYVCSDLFITEFESFINSEPFSPFF